MQHVAVGHLAVLVAREDFPPPVAVAQFAFGDPPQRVTLLHRVDPAVGGDGRALGIGGTEWRSLCGLLLWVACRVRLGEGGVGTGGAQHGVGAIPPRRCLEGPHHRLGGGEGGG